MSGCECGVITFFVKLCSHEEGDQFALNAEYLGVFFKQSHHDFREDIKVGI